ncbi:TPA: type I glyceraldehyde-3-phosphate dehydrogenase [Candidatus Dependentiae bacterium]|nr:MAG: Glyceraldehyde-3-phosphate dehydrogenase, type I [candidate division TM6 bacterium GW2011_GWF2_43_87]HBL98570.1 type I glyceraldehyde-3-phosphate dehydrogenase [Candidatus Dependentiae bacterium]
MRIAINGFGRIGRTFLRVLLENPDRAKKIEVVAVNMGGNDIAAAAHMFKYDTTMGTYEGVVSVVGNILTVGHYKIRLLSEKSAENLPWRDLNIDWVVDCSGRYTKAEDAYQHIRAGAKRILISAPAQGADCTIIPGVNDQKYDASNHLIVSLGSCTTNALMPTLKVIQDAFLIESAFVVTTHSYTATQALVDGGASGADLRKYRAAPLNIVPATTGADKLVGEVIPELEGRVAAVAIRVPVANVSLLEVTWTSGHVLTKEGVLKAFDDAAKGALKGILDTTDEQLVSSDYLGNPFSVVIDRPLVGVNGRMATVFGWYDNEWGYCCRLGDFLAKHA